MIRKLLICPYFGEFPSWMPKWECSVARLAPLGYDVLVDTDEAAFRVRVEHILGVTVPPGIYGTGKTWDYRAALGVLYADELDGYDFWGHTDFDCVYGRVDQFVTDDLLDGLDVFSNHDVYQCGCWALYRNIPVVNELFAARVPDWRSHLEDGAPTAWVEESFSRAVEAADGRGDLRKLWVQWQAFTVGALDALRQDPDGALYVNDQEVMMAHFRRTKEWPV